MAPVAIIGQAIQNLASMPDAARGMLLKALPHACEGVAEHKDAMQLRVLNLIASNVQQSKASFMQEGADRQEAGAAATMQLEQCQAAVAAAAKGVLTADAVVAAKMQEHDAATATAQGSAQQHSRAEVQVQRTLSAWQQLRDASQLAEEASSAASALAEGTCEPDEVAKRIEQLEVFLAGARAEKVLIAAATVALAVAAESRSSFDAMTVQHVVEVVEAKRLARRQAVADIEQQEAELKAEILGMWAITEVDAEAEQEASAALAEAEAARSAAQRTLDRAKKAEASAQKTICDHSTELVLIEERSKQADAALEAIDRVIAGAERTEEALPPADADMQDASTAADADMQDVNTAADADMQDVKTAAAKMQGMEEAPIQSAVAGA